MQWSPLAPRARWLFHVRALVRLLVVMPPVAIAAFVGLAWYVDAMVGGGVAVGIAFLATVWALWMPTLRFDRWGYALSDVELLIRSGVLSRRITAIPAGRIQHVDTHQGPMDQLFGLARLHVYTASGMGADGVIPGLDRQEAERLRDQLVRASEEDDGV